MPEGYCVKERKKVEIKDAKQVTMKNGRPAIQGVCPDCGTKYPIERGIPRLLPPELSSAELETSEESWSGNEIENKRMEWARYRAQVTNYEIDEYLPIL